MGGERIVCHGPMFQQHALGTTGGAGGVNDHREIVEANRAIQIGRFCVVAIASEQHGFAIVFRQLIEQLWVNENDVWPSVFQHISQALSGKIRVER